MSREGLPYWNGWGPETGDVSQKESEREVWERGAVGSWPDRAPDVD